MRDYRRFPLTPPKKGSICVHWHFFDGFLRLDVRVLTFDHHDDNIFCREKCACFDRKKSFDITCIRREKNAKNNKNFSSYFCFFKAKISPFFEGSVVQNLIKHQEEKIIFQQNVFYFVKLFESSLKIYFGPLGTSWGLRNHFGSQKELKKVQKYHIPRWAEL